MTVHPFVQSAVDRIPVYGTPRTVIAVGSLLIETYLKYTAPDFPTKSEKVGLDIKIKGLRIIQILALLGATRIFSSKLISIPVSIGMVVLWIPKIEKFIDLCTGAKELDGKVNTNIRSCTPIINNALLYGGYCTKVVNIFASKLFSQKPVSAVATGVSSMAVAYLTLYNGFKDFDL
jgi:hypothetical protein